MVATLPILFAMAAIAQAPQESPIAKVDHPRSSRGSQAVGWIAWPIFAVLGLCSGIAVLGDPASADRPGVRYGFAFGWMVFAVAMIVLAIRQVRLAVWIADGQVHVRNYFRSHAFPVVDVESFQYGDPDGWSTMKLAGSVRLRSGGSLGLSAISSVGLLDRRRPGLVEDLNEAAREMQRQSGSVSATLASSAISGVPR